uniref:Putative conserved plasma membrane protein n=1 Tax=Xenopsylla cheopis TaxID=163159 RepID=A0A6M2DZY3_XENCH
MNNAQIFLLLTISGTTASETISDLTVWKENPREYETMMNRYNWKRTLQNLKDIGHLTVKVFGATGLASADLGGKSDPFCVIELGNARLQTQTEYKTLSPNWQKIFTFNIKDITSVLEVTVFDEDRNNKVEFLGKIAVPLLRIRNGERKWYALKDKKLHHRAKGLAPQILLEMTIAWSPIRAALRALTPKEEKFMKPEIKFKRQIFVRNVLRLKKIILYFLEIGRLVQSCFEWESRTRSFLGLLLWLALCHFFNVCFIPLCGMILLIRNWFRRWILLPVDVCNNSQYYPNAVQSPSDEEDALSEEEDDDDKDKACASWRRD